MTCRLLCGSSDPDARYEASTHARSLLRLSAPRVYLRCSSVPLMYSKSCSSLDSSCTVLLDTRVHRKATGSSMSMRVRIDTYSNLADTQWKRSSARSPVNCLEVLSTSNRSFLAGECAFRLTARPDSEMASSRYWRIVIPAVPLSVYLISIPRNVCFLSRKTVIFWKHSSIFFNDVRHDLLIHVRYLCIVDVPRNGALFSVYHLVVSHVRQVLAAYVPIDL